MVLPCSDAYVFTLLILLRGCCHWFISGICLEPLFSPTVLEFKTGSLQVGYYFLNMVLNISTNQNVSEAFNLEYSEFRITKISLYILIFTLSCIGNSLVAIVIIRARGSWTSANMLILNLALCDLVLPTLSIPFDFALEEGNYIWPFGSGMCKVLWPFQTAFSTSSSLTLVAISLDRYRTIGKPLSRRVSTGKVPVFLSTIHVISISLCIPYFIALGYHEAEGYCVESWSNFHHRQAYTIVLFLCQYALPLVTMCVAYLLIYRSLRLNTAILFSADRKSERRRNSSRLSTNMDDMEFKRKEQNIRLAKMFVFVVVVFAISMFPNQVLWLWVDFGNGAENKFFHYISVVCRLFTYANSVLNPFIYALKSREFRSGFARIGRQSMQPLRKISSGSRKIARKVSRSVWNNNQPGIIPVLVTSPSSSPLERSDDVFETTVKFELSSESLDLLPPTRKATRKYPCYEVRSPLDNNLCADSRLPPIKNGFVALEYKGSGRYIGKMAASNCISGTELPIGNKLESMNNINDKAATPRALINSRFQKMLQELPETDCWSKRFPAHLHKGLSLWNCFMKGTRQVYNKLLM